jgi:hypothetical protein
MKLTKQKTVSVSGLSFNKNILYPSEKFLSKNVWLGYVESHTNTNKINDGVIPIA